MSMTRRSSGRRAKYSRTRSRVRVARGTSLGWSTTRKLPSYSPRALTGDVGLHVALPAGEPVVEVPGREDELAARVLTVEHVEVRCSARGCPNRRRRRRGRRAAAAHRPVPVGWRRGSRRLVAPPRRALCRPSGCCATRGSRARRAVSVYRSCSVRCRRPSSGALEEPSGIERQAEPLELGIGVELAVALESSCSASLGPGPKPVHTGLPLTIVSATIT